MAPAQAVFNASTIGLYFLRNSNTSGIADNTFLYGPANSAVTVQPITGDWTGSGVDTVGLHDSTGSTFLLRNSNDSRFANETFVYGPANSTGTTLVGTWDAPTVTSISPTAGAASGGTSVTINGSGFSGTTSVQFGPTLAASFTIVADSQITAVSPAGTGTVNVTVANAGGICAPTTADPFTYGVAPVSFVWPTVGATIGPTGLV